MGHGKYVGVHLFWWCTASLKVWYIYSDISSKACVHACLTKCYRMIERNKDGPDHDSNPGPWISSQMLYSLRSAGSGIWTSLSAHSSPHLPPPPKWALPTKITISRLFPLAGVHLSIPEVGKVPHELGWEKYKGPDRNSYPGSLNFFSGALPTELLGPGIWTGLTNTH